MGKLRGAPVSRSGVHIFIVATLSYLHCTHRYDVQCLIYHPMLHKLELVDWFGDKVRHWTHLTTYRIRHALPDQSPPTANPYLQQSSVRSGVFVCGEYDSLPGIQWALLSGCRAADAVQAHLKRGL